jgi:hypothetical protein
LQNQHIIIVYSILSALAGMIPIPFLDDAVADFFSRRMVAGLANSYGMKLSAAELSILSTAQGSGCFMGLLQRGLMHPIKAILKRILKDIFFVWIIQGIGQQFTRCYYRGYLLDYAFSDLAYVPGTLDSARRMNSMVNSVCSRANLHLLSRTVQALFRASWRLIKLAGGLVAQTAKNAFRHILRATLQRKTRLEKDEIRKTFVQDLVDLENLPQVNQLAGLLSDEITKLPETHFAQMKMELKGLTASQIQNAA